MQNICFSGGATGADTVFGEQATKASHKVIHYGFKGHKSSCSQLILNEFYLIQADPFLFEANKFLKRRYPTQSAYSNSLLRRNYYQIGESDTVYAISSIGERGMVDGGTSWAVTMAICNGIKEVYVFDCKKDYWMKFVGINKNEFNWCAAMYVPTPYGKYTGIGKRYLPENGRCAIESLYGSLSNRVEN